MAEEPAQQQPVKQPEKKEKQPKSFVESMLESANKTKAGPKNQDLAEMSKDEMKKVTDFAEKFKKGGTRK